MSSFSERKGLRPVSKIIQIDSMNDALRNSLWSALDISIWSEEGFLYTSITLDAGAIEDFSEALWFEVYKEPVDDRPKLNYPARGRATLEIIRERYFKYEWNEVYDFIEFLISYFTRIGWRVDGIVQDLNSVLEREMSGYRIVNGLVVDVTDQQEIDMLEEALTDSQFKNVSAHLERSLALLSDRKKPDYRNSIKVQIAIKSAGQCTKPAC